MNKKRKNNNFLINVALIVLVLVVFSSIFASDLFAKYRSGGVSEEEARVAGWGVSMEAGPLIEILPGGETSVTYPITIVNSSETAVVYDISISFDQSVADLIADPKMNGVAPAEGSEYTTVLTFTSIGTLPPSVYSTPQSDVLNLTFTVSGDFMNSFVDAGEDYDNEIISGAFSQVPFSVNAVIRQID